MLGDDSYAISTRGLKYNGNIGKHVWVQRSSCSVAATIFGTRIYIPRTTHHDSKSFVNCFTIQTSKQRL